MADPAPPGSRGAAAGSGARRGRSLLRLAQLLLVAGAAGLWGASRLPWLAIRSFDGLGQPRQVTVSGAAWSTALLPLAALSLTAALVVIPAGAVRGWALRVLAVLLAAASWAAGYLAISMWVAKDVTARGAAIAEIPVVSLVAGDRRYGGSVVTLLAAVCILGAAMLMMRSAAAGAGGSGSRYSAPAARRAAARRGGAAPNPADLAEMSEQMLWDALDAGADPTDDSADRPLGPQAEGR